VIKQLRKVGNSNALILDKPLLELIGLADDGEVQIVVSNGSLVITPVSPKQVDEQRFQQCLDRVQQEWGDVLQRLAL